MSKNKQDIIKTGQNESISIVVFLLSYNTIFYVRCLKLHKFVGIALRIQDTSRDWNVIMSTYKDT